LARHGFETVHWSTIGAATAPDRKILEWAHEHDFVVVTNDLDFSAILAAGAVDGPSVVQIRAQDLLSEGTISTVAKALEGHRDDVERGALLSIDEGGTRVRMLPLKGPRSRNPTPLADLRSIPLVADCWTSIDEKQGGTQTREVCSPLVGGRLPSKCAAA
jgi:predicted nuclease of predicted toxin-antitoxin system